MHDYPAPNATLTARARESLTGQWGTAIAAAIVFGVLSFGISIIPVLGSIISLLIYGAFCIGYSRVFLTLVRRQSPRLELLFSGFRQFDTGLIAYIVMIVFILLWSLLLIIPGIIAYYAYSMTFYLLADNPSLSAMDALRQSKAMMHGHKWQAFRLSLRLLGWMLLCILTLGIGFIWFAPYAMTCWTQFYEELKTGETTQLIDPVSPAQ